MCKTRCLDWGEDLVVVPLNDQLLNASSWPYFYLIIVPVDAQSIDVRFENTLMRVVRVHSERRCLRMMMLMSRWLLRSRSVMMVVMVSPSSASSLRSMRLMELRLHAVHCSLRLLGLL